jgi:hypothetical protein
MTWVANPSLMQTDIKSYQMTINSVNSEVQAVELEEDRWFNSFEVARRRLTSSFTASRKDKAKLMAEFNLLQQLCQQEIEYPASNLNVTNAENATTAQSRKKRSTFMRDVAYELVERQDTLTSKLCEYEKLLINAKTNDLFNGKDAFMVDIQMNDDLNYSKCPSMFIFYSYCLIILFIAILKSKIPDLMFHLPLLLLLVQKLSK